MELLKFDDDRIDWSDLSTMKDITCINHPTARYLSKNPFNRSLHFISPPQEFFDGKFEKGIYECPCPFSDLRVVIKDPEPQLSPQEHIQNRAKEMLDIMRAGL